MRNRLFSLFIFPMMLNYQPIIIKTQISHLTEIQILTESLSDQDLPQLDNIVKEGGDINSVDKFGRSMLINAALKGDLSSVKLLLERKANINHQDGAGMTALMVASFLGHKEIVEFLLESGADLEIKTFDDERSAIIWAAISSELNTLELLVKAGANVNDVTSDGKTVLMHAKDTAVRYLIESGANINAIDKNGVTPLIYAVIENQVKKVSELLEMGAKADLKDSFGRTALFYAIAMKNRDVLSLLEKVEKYK